jgi:CBS domain-containing protein
MAERSLLDVLRNRRPVTIAPNATVAEACQRMREHRVGAVLVTNPVGQLQGIFTGRDAVRTLAQATPADTPVRQAMTTAPCTMDARGTAIEALRLMEDGGFRHVPVVEDDRVIGIVSWGDFRSAEHDRLETELDYWQRI